MCRAFFDSVRVEVEGKDIKKVKIQFIVSQNMFILNGTNDLL